MLEAPNRKCCFNLFHL